MAKLNQILAIEKGIKTRVYAAFTELHQATQKPALMNGFHKSYQPRDEEGETYPAESQKVQHNAGEVLERVGKDLAELFGITAAKDWANCTARADVVVDGKTVLESVPATYLLFLEKPTLRSAHGRHEDERASTPAATGTSDPGTGLYKTEPSLTQRTKKVQRPITLCEATARSIRPRRSSSPRTSSPARGAIREVLRGDAGAAQDAPAACADREAVQRRQARAQEASSTRPKRRTRSSARGVRLLVQLVTFLSRRQAQAHVQADPTRSARRGGLESSRDHALGPRGETVDAAVHPGPCRAAGRRLRDYLPDSRCRAFVISELRRPGPETPVRFRQGTSHFSSFAVRFLGLTASRGHEDLSVDKCR